MFSVHVEQQGLCSALHEEGLAFAGGIDALQRKGRHQRPSGGQRQNTLPTAAHQARLNQPVPKALDKDGDCFTYLCQAFPGLTMEKLKTGIFDGPQIRQFNRDPEFENSMNEKELEVWKAFVLVVNNFFGNNKSRNYAELVNNMLTAYRNLGCNMSVQMHCLFTHMDRFPENLGDEQGKRFHQDLKEMETRYQGGWDAVMMADNCWNLKRDLPVAEHSRSSKKRKFKP